jgi:hypothetical protein
VSSTATTITLAWDHPVETGGANVTGYILELNDWAGGGDWITAYDGTGNPHVRSATITEPYVMPGRRYVQRSSLRLQWVGRVVVPVLSAVSRVFFVCASHHGCGSHPTLPSHMRAGTSSGSRRATWSAAPPRPPR